MTLDKRVQEALDDEIAQLPIGYEVEIISSHVLPTHVPGDSGLVITFKVRSYPEMSASGRRLVQTRFSIHGGSNAQYSRHGGILMTTWEDA